MSASYIIIVCIAFIYSILHFMIGTEVAGFNLVSLTYLVVLWFIILTAKSEFSSIIVIILIPPVLLLILVTLALAIVVLFYVSDVIYCKFNKLHESDTIVLCGLNLNIKQSFKTVRIMFNDYELLSSNSKLTDKEVESKLLAECRFISLVREYPKHVRPKFNIISRQFIKNYSISNDSYFITHRTVSKYCKK